MGYYKPNVYGVKYMDTENEYLKDKADSDKQGPQTSDFRKELIFNLERHFQRGDPELDDNLLIDHVFPILGKMSNTIKNLKFELKKSYRRMDDILNERNRAIKDAQHYRKMVNNQKSVTHDCSEIIRAHAKMMKTTGPEGITCDKEPK